MSGEAGEAGKASETPGDESSTTGKDASVFDDAGSDDDSGIAEGEDPTPESMKVTIRFKAKVGDKDFACGGKYAAQGSASTTVTPRDLRLFVHGVALIQADGTKVPVALNARAPWQSETLALLDFEDNTGRCAEGTLEVNTAITGTVATGSYTGISFVSGVPEELNHADPRMAGDPLQSAASLSLSRLEGFRFAKIELVTTAPPGEPIGIGLFQPTSTQCTSKEDGDTVTCAKPNRSAVSLTAFDFAKNSIVIDIATLFSQLDLSQVQECQSTAATCESMFNAYGVDYATGAPKEGQTLFKVE